MSQAPYTPAQDVVRFSVSWPPVYGVEEFESDCIPVKLVCWRGLSDDAAEWSKDHAMNAQFRSRAWRTGLLRCNGRSRPIVTTANSM